MRNFKTVSTVTTTEFTGAYNEALSFARNEQKVAPDNVSYTIDGEEGGTAVVKKHEVFGGGSPVYQPIVHNEN
jgi:hypothetical protein